MAATIYVSPGGSDSASGTRNHPLRTFVAAQQAVRRLKAHSAVPVTVIFRAGTYYLPEPVVFRQEDSGTQDAPVTYAAAPGETAVISGGTKLALTWKPYRDGIYQAVVSADLVTDQLFVDGEQQRMARYPNYDPGGGHWNGWSADAFSRERAARWSDPQGGYIHAMHRYLWGDFHYLITGKDQNGDVTYEGGWQNNRRLGMHDQYRFVENIFEELDAPGEWFHDRKHHLLYYYPPSGIDPGHAAVEAVRLRNLIEFHGSAERPVRCIRLRGLTFRHAARTFMENREPLLRSDWTIYRGGAILFAGAEDCALEDSVLDQPGGNAVFVSGYNRHIVVRGCRISRAGANGIAFVGDPGAVRSPLFEYDQRHHIGDIDRVPGPQTPDYPAECLVDDCLIYQTGRIEKQSAPIEIAMSKDITVRHCSLYDVPRAGINIGDGCWGGHVIEYCDIFDTVKETGDHGSFNSWGRDRYWGLQGIDLQTIASGSERDLPLLDTVRPIVLRNNRWRCDHGWDIDLDDGSSNYHIIDNLCLKGGIKLREGFYRVCENNIMVDNSLHPHVWFRDSQDIVRHNIVFTPYQPIEVPQPWGQECDWNLMHMPGKGEPSSATVLARQSGRDEHSLAADAEFVDPARGDYRVAAGSPALKLGFRNFPMDRFGVQSPGLRTLARRPDLPGAGGQIGVEQASARDGRVRIWLGASIKNVVGLGEVSAYGLPGEIGVLIVDAPVGSAAAADGLRRGDVILKFDGGKTDTVQVLLALVAARKQRDVRILIYRDQHEVVLVLKDRDPQKTEGSGE